MSTSDNLDTVRRWIALAERGFDGDFRDIFTTDYAGHIAGRVHLDLALLQQTERGFGLAFTEVVRTVDELLAFEDRAVMRITTRARHTGDFRGIAATGRPIGVTALVLYRFREARICESWTEFDLAGLLTQMSAPATGGSSSPSRSLPP